MMLMMMMVKMTMEVMVMVAREGFPDYLTRQGPEARRIFKLRKCSYAVSYVYITVAIVAQAT